MALSMYRLSVFELKRIKISTFRKPHCIGFSTKDTFFLFSHPISSHTLRQSDHTACKTPSHHHSTSTMSKQCFHKVVPSVYTGTLLKPILISFSHWKYYSFYHFSFNQTVNSYILHPEYYTLYTMHYIFWF